MIRSVGFLIILFLSFLTGYSQNVIPLYKGDIPNAILNKDSETPHTNQKELEASQPTLSIYFPEKGKSNGTAVIICPGGGYETLVIKREGYEVAQAFANIGVTAFVLKYRLPDDKQMGNKTIGPLQDAQQAILTIRENAKNWHINPDKIGIMGFSAGGHLASTAGTHFNQTLIDNKDKISLRPDFMILVYPVISFKNSITHMGSRDNLLGKSPSTDLINSYSNELQVTKNTPPTFIVHAGDDELVPVENSLLFYEALRKNSVPAALHIYTKGGHGFLSYPPFEEWFAQCTFWMDNI